MTGLFPAVVRWFRRRSSVLKRCRRQLAVTFTALLLVVAGHAADWQSVSAGANTASLNGAGVARQLNEDMYIALLYVSRPSRQAAELLDSRQRRQLQLRVLADRLYPSGVARHFRDLVAINNPRDEIAREAKNLNQFYGLFQHGLMRGDELVLDNLTDNGLRVRINGATVASFSSPLLFDLLLRAYLGERPLSTQLRSALLGEPDSAGRNTVIERFAALQPSDERKTVYNKPVAESAPAPVADNKATAATTIAATAASKPAVSTDPIATASSKPAAPAANKAVAAASITKPPATKAAAVEPPASSRTVSAPAAATNPVAAPDQPLTTATMPVEVVAAPVLSEAEISTLLADYEQRLRTQLQEKLEYPVREMRRKYGNTQLARRKETLQLRLHLDTGGDINAAWLQTRSGEPILDDAALKLVEAQAPFAPLPKALPDSAYEFLIPLQFDPDR